MTKATTNVARVAAAVAGLGLVAVSFAPMAGAQTSTTTTTTTTSASVSFSSNLHVGSSGADVTALQNWLIAQGFSIKAGATGYFGGQTRAALAKFQAANGIVPASGFFGPITRAKVAAMGGSSSSSGSVAGCAPGAAFSSTTGQPCGSSSNSGSLSGGEGLLTNFKQVGAASTALNAGQSNTVFGVEFQAAGSDLSVNRVSIDATLTAGSGSTRPWTVFNQAQLMHGNTVVATLDASNSANWSQDGTATAAPSNTLYRLNFGGLNDVVKMGQTADYYLVLSTQSNVNSSNNGNVYTLSLPSQGIRATDAKGLSEYSTGSATATVSISSSVSGSLTVSTGSGNPQATTLQANQSSMTSGVTLASFTLNAQAGDVTVYTIPVSVATTSNNASDIIRQIYLKDSSGNTLDTESYAAGSSATSVKFKNLNIKIPSGTTSTFNVVADINQVGGTNTVVEGASVAASIPNSGFEAVNSAGNNVSVTGSVTGNTITFRTIGLSVDNAPSSMTATPSAVGTSGTQMGTYTFVFNVTAFGQDVYFAKSAATSTAYAIYQNGSASSTVSSTVALTSAADTSTGNTANYVVHSGQSKQVTVTVTVPAGANQSLSAVLQSIKWGVTDATAQSAASSTPFSNNYQTAPIYLHS